MINSLTMGWFYEFNEFVYEHLSGTLKCHNKPRNEGKEKEGEKNEGECRKWERRVNLPVRITQSKDSDIHLGAFPPASLHTETCLSHIWKIAVSWGDLW